jgi:Skp family chaperone for outer membrane proteins
MENELKNKENEIIKIKNIISENELNNKMNLLNDEIKKYRNFKNKITSELNQSKENEIKVFFERINPIIENYMNSNSISIIIDQKNIFIARSENDITNDILSLINSKF